MLTHQIQRFDIHDRNFVNFLQVVFNIKFSHLARNMKRNNIWWVNSVVRCRIDQLHPKVWKEYSKLWVTSCINRIPKIFKFSGFVLSPPQPRGIDFQFDKVFIKFNFFFCLTSTQTLVKYFGINITGLENKEAEISVKNTNS